jgi:1-acyl-sn-glycerol-3-phosphate acyltransferase
MSPLAFLSRPSQWLRAIHRHGGTMSGGPNFCYELCLRRIPDHELEGLDLSSWRFAFNGAEPVSPDTMIAFTEKFAPYQFNRNAMNPVYGLAEASVGLTLSPGTPWQMDLLDRDRFSRTGEAVLAAKDDPAPLKVVACGSVIPDHDLRVIDGAGLELPDRTEGALQFRGPSATTGYYRNPEATKALFDGEWVNTGDRAYLSDGMLYITGREKDIIIRGGRNISPYELEEAVGDIPGVRRGCVAVFGSQDPASGTERIVVLAESRDPQGAGEADIKRRINDLAMNLIGAPVDDIVLAPPHTVPKTSSGKIRRVAARDYYERGPDAVRSQAVWLQFIRLAAAGVAPQLRRGWRVARGMLFALRAYVVFALTTPWIFLAAATKNVGLTWKVGGVMTRLFLRFAGLPVLVRGVQNIPPGPVVLTANHTSYFDALILVAILGPRNFSFIAKREFLANPLMRLLLVGFGCVFVERFDVQAAAEHADELADAAKRGRSLAIFPEGTLLRRPGLLPFRTGAFQVAVQAGIPVVPVAVRGARSVLRDGTWYARRYPMAVTFGAPIAPDGDDWNAAVRLRDRVRAEVLKHCGEPDMQRS